MLFSVSYPGGHSTIEILQRTQIFKVICCLKVHNAHVKLTLQILGSDSDSQVNIFKSGRIQPIHVIF